MRGRWPDVAIAGALLLLVGVGALRWLDVTAYPVVVLQTTGPFVVIGLVLLLVVAALLRRWAVLVPVGVAALTAGVIAVPAFLSEADPTATRALTAMSVNLFKGRADADQVMDAVRFHAVDVLVLVEVTRDAVRRLDAAGLADYFPERVGEPAAGDGTGGVMVLSRYRVTAVQPGADRPAPGSSSAQPEVTIDVAGTPVRVKAVHPEAPGPRTSAQWRADLRALAAWRGSRPPGERLIVLGDFNASAGHPAFREVAEGLQDAQRAAGGGWVRTWPFVGRRMPPWVQLDHVLSRGLVLTDAGQVAVHGTDHAIVWGAYALTRGG
ncbi:MAG TPA: endonuclease/exonuclease/phosphatase family protein [Intrasporangium sp.]|uniref:endonuclease/exonuclease/phosphatase family protein n=1 Tax=Intrasporangium sp. TaxID=1925024 RepID=UPI002D7A2B54|nr:endonuclease/exonuclease/phosphatase family protein [Intrasporangium sp.]HET7397929.1 endonuclease/exonuclease/phosphatase family protein [Intrasporangium sp.]